MFIRQNEAFGQEVQVALWVFKLHLPQINNHPVFACQFMRTRKVINSLLSGQTVKKVSLSGGVSPQNIPIVPLGLFQAVQFKYKLNKPALALKQFILQIGSLPLRVPWFSCSLKRWQVGGETYRVDSFEQRFIVH